MKILALIPTLNDDPTDTVESLKKQTMPPDRIIVVCGSEELSQKLATRGIESIYLKPDFSKDIGTRIAQALNVGLSAVNSKDFDYLVRSDADTILPPNFVEANLPQPHLLHGHLIFPMRAIEEIFGGRFVEGNAEDTYHIYKLMERGFVVTEWRVAPISKRSGGEDKPWRYFFQGGETAYEMGHEPIHYLFNVLVLLVKERQPKRFFLYLGYLYAMLGRSEKRDSHFWLERKQRVFHWRNAAKFFTRESRVLVINLLGKAHRRKTTPS